MLHNTNTAFTLITAFCQQNVLFQIVLVEGYCLPRIFRKLQPGILKTEQRFIPN